MRAPLVSCIAPVVALLVAACASAPPSSPTPPPPASAVAPTASVDPGERALPPAKPTDPIEVAVTVDDLPRHGPDVPGVTRVAIHDAMLAAFAKHYVPRVVGFVNAQRLAGHSEDGEALRHWVAAGHPLGNHTFSHADAAKVSFEDFLADVDRNEETLRTFAGVDERAWQYFRFPYLREGADLPTRTRIRAEIAGRGYRFAPVTIDFYDWAYQPPHARCLAKHDDPAIAALKESYLDQAAAALRNADGAAREIFGRPTKQILLLHVGWFSALMLDDLLSTYEKNGARFVSLDEALADAAIAGEIERPAIPYGAVFTQLRKARGTRSPVILPPPDVLLEHVCK